MRKVSTEHKVLSAKYKECEKCEECEMKKVRKERKVQSKIGGQNINFAHPTQASGQIAG